MRRPSEPIVRPMESLPELQTASMVPTSRASLISFRPSSRLPVLDRRRSRSVELDHSPVDPHWELIASNLSKASRPVVVVEPTTIDDGWEADIDYCYEHAVEASCEYEWLSETGPIGSKDAGDPPLDVISEPEVEGLARASTLLTDLAGPAKLVAKKGERGEGCPNRPRSKSRSSSRPPSLVVSTEVGLLQLDPSPVLTVSSDSEVTTPAPALDPVDSSPHFRSAFLRNPFKESGLFVVDHSLCLPPEEDADGDDDNARAVRHYPLHDVVEDLVESEMESCPSRSSLRNRISQESVDVREDMVRASRRRQEGSVSTVPELVHSRRGSEELDHTESPSSSDSGRSEDVQMRSVETAHSRRTLSIPKAISHSNLHHAVTIATVTPTATASAVDLSRLSSRERSQSEGMAKVVVNNIGAAAANNHTTTNTITTRRRADTKTMSRNQSSSSLRSLPAPSATAASTASSSSTRFSYVLFPTTS